MPYLNLLMILLLSTTTLLGQFECPDLKIIGIYQNNVQVRQISLVLTSNRTIPDGNGLVYTSFQIITENGDSLLKADACPCYRLPQSGEDTIVYSLGLHENIGHLSEFPESFCGRLVVRDPDCELPICYQEQEAPDLPAQDWATCADLHPIGLYRARTPTGGRILSMLMTLKTPDYRTLSSAYTSYRLTNREGNPLSSLSNPSYTLPQFSADTIVLHFPDLQELPSGSCPVLDLFDPDCRISFCRSSTSLSVTLAQEIRVFPNPARDELNIGSSFPIRLIELFDHSGKAMLTTRQKTIDLSTFPSGLYFLRVIPKTGEEHWAKVVRE